MAPLHCTMQPKVHIPDITHPAFYSTTSLQLFRGSSSAPPFISREPPFCTKTLPEPRHGVMGNADPNPNRVGPSEPPLNFVDGNGYIVLRGSVEARDCEVGRGKVMRAWGGGDENIVAKKFNCFSTPGGAQSGQEILTCPGVGKAKARWGRGWGGALFKKFHPPPPCGKCP